VNMGGHEMAPHTPQRSERPGEAGPLLYPAPSGAAGRAVPLDAGPLGVVR
jgi:hypothetical protein